ncbi:hypothetical protein Tco_1135107 [Tanacetum coccineum]
MLQRSTYDIDVSSNGSTDEQKRRKPCKSDFRRPASTLFKAFHKKNVFLSSISDENGHKQQDKISDKKQKIALSISNLKKPLLPRLCLKNSFPSMWVESEQEYDISAVYGITYWWFRRKEFYINKYSEPSDREAVRSQMRISSVENQCQGIKNQLQLPKRDNSILLIYQDNKISRKEDLQKFYPNDLKDSFPYQYSRKAQPSPRQRRQSLRNSINYVDKKPDAADYYFKEDYTIVPKPRAVVYRDINDQRKLMRLNELHKFSDGTLTKSRNKLDHREEAKTSSQQSRKDYILRRIIEFKKALWKEE